MMEYFLNIVLGVAGVLVLVAVMVLLISMYYARPR